MYLNPGGGALAVPGEVAGYWKAWQLYGCVPWKELFQPAIHLAEGHNVSGSLAKYIKSNFNFIEKYDNLR